MTGTQGKKKKKPPTFPYLPKDRAQQLKKSWIEDHKIRSKWKAQKRREGLTNQTSAVGDTPNHSHDKTVADSKRGISPEHPDDSSPPTPCHNKRSLRDLRKLAYASKLPAQKASSSRSTSVLAHSHNNRDGKAAMRRESSQPNMELRMNVLLEKIKRDFS